MVQFEYLAQDFNPLAHQYQLPLAIPEHKENAHTYDPDTLTVSDLTPYTLQLMNTICAKDFELGRGYEMVWEPPPKPTVSNNETTTATTNTTRRR